MADGPAAKYVSLNNIRNNTAMSEGGEVSRRRAAGGSVGPDGGGKLKYWAITINAYYLGIKLGCTGSGMLAKRASLRTTRPGAANIWKRQLGGS